MHADRYAQATGPPQAPPQTPVAIPVLPGTHGVTARRPAPLPLHQPALPLTHGAAAGSRAQLLRQLLQQTHGLNGIQKPQLQLLRPTHGQDGVTREKIAQPLSQPPPALGASGTQQQ